MKRKRAIAFLTTAFRWFFTLEPVVLSALLLVVVGLWAFAQIAEQIHETSAGGIDTERK